MGSFPKIRYKRPIAATMSPLAGYDDTDCFSEAPPEEALAHPEWERANSMPSNSLLGTAEDIKSGLIELAKAAEASEVMIYGATYGVTERIKSLELIADAWDLGK